MGDCFIDKHRVFIYKASLILRIVGVLVVLFGMFVAPSMVQDLTAFIFWLAGVALILFGWVVANALNAQVIYHQKQEHLSKIRSHFKQ
ncbi:hypothetical protein [Pleionea mediterranea]|uniref:Uncharacterized protein n=1 Tax=Pleionea mediterranea TaxID=523701 RepID=A0A316F9F0_9GAMM|nr:hypothetical protein [Pleionea mediterranea]PWK41523.1 hypothetical protein C8D97_1226 [Pleionea mediterranea]